MWLDGLVGWNVQGGQRVEEAVEGHAQVTTGDQLALARQANCHTALHKEWLGITPEVSFSIWLILTQAGLIQHTVALREVVEKWSFALRGWPQIRRQIIFFWLILALKFDYLIIKTYLITYVQAHLHICASAQKCVPVPGLKLKNWSVGGRGNVQKLRASTHRDSWASPGADLFGLQTLAEKLSTVCCAKISYICTQWCRRT